MKKTKGVEIMVSVFVTGMIAGMGLYLEIQKARLETALKEVKRENEKLKKPGGTR